MISTTLLRQCPSFRPGVAYVLHNALYLQPCARNVAATSLLASRGPGFALPADCGFERLDPNSEPTAAELAAVVDEVYAASTASAGAMGENDAGITFARAEGIVPAPEANHAVKGAIAEAMRCKEEGVSRAILFNLCGHGYFDMQAYTDYNAGKLEDHAYDESEVAMALAGLPSVA